MCQFSINEDDNVQVNYEVRSEMVRACINC